MKVGRADFLQLNFEPINDGQFLSCFQAHRKHIPSPNLSKYIKEFAEQHVNHHSFQLFDKTQFIALEASGKPLKGFPYTYIIFIPVHLKQQRTGVLSLGFITDSEPDTFAVELLANELTMLLMKIQLVRTQLQLEKNNALLLNFSQMLSPVVNRQQLFMVLHNQLKKQLDFTYSTVFMMNEKGSELKDFLFDPNTATVENPFQNELRIGKFPIDSDISLESYQNNTQLIYDFDELTANHKIYPFLNSDKTNADKTGFLINLFKGRDVIGNWIVLFKTSQSQHTGLLHLLQLLAAQLTGTILNIMHLEKIEEREFEYGIIQSINSDLSSNLNKDDILGTIHLKMKHLFDFAHHYVAAINEDGATIGTFLKDSESKSRFHPNYRAITKTKYPLNDPVFYKGMLSRDAVIYDMDLMLTRGSLPEYMAINYECGIRKTVVIGLHVGTRILGVWVINLTETQEMNAKQLKLVKDISHQLSIACDNLIANAAVLKRKAESEFLLKLSADITTIRTKRDLFSIINKNLKKLFDFEEIVIMALNENSTYSSFLHSSVLYGAEEFIYPEFPTQQFPCNDGIFNIAADHASAYVFHLDEIIKDPNLPQYLLKEYEQGIRTKVAVTLRDNSHIKGLLFVNAKEETIYTDHQVDLIYGASLQFATAFSNILGSEENQEREGERNLLLSFSNQIAAVRDYDQLLQVITFQLKKVLGFSHIMVGTMSDDDEYFSAYLLDPDTKNKNHPIHRINTIRRFPVDDGVINKVFTSGLPVTLDLNTLAEQQDLPVYLNINRESGINQAIAARFSKGVFAFGFLMIFYEAVTPPDARALSLIAGLAQQIAITVSNIIANEDIQKKEAAKTKLLKFSGAIASIRSKEELSDVIDEQLIGLKICEGYELRLLTAEKKSTYSYLSNFSSFAEHELGNPEGQVSSVEEVCPFIDCVLKSGKPAIYNLKEFPVDDTTPQWMNQWNSIGVKQLIGVPLVTGKNNLGALLLTVEDAMESKEDHFQLLSSICSQMAIAVSNISANEEIQQRAHEKSLLLNFSNAIASVRGKKELSLVINRYMKDMGLIREYAVHALSDNKLTHQLFLFDPEANFTRHSDFGQPDRFYDVEDGFMNTVLASSSPVLFNVNKANEGAVTPAYVRFWKTFGFEEALGLPLRFGKENIGMMVIHPASTYNATEEENQLLESICSQIAISVSNIKANEKVNDQLKEIASYKQQLEEEKIYLTEEIETTYNYAEIVGESEEVKKTYKLVDQVAASDSTVLILGETGTGKELIARAIHSNSPRKGKLMVKVNCAALPANLIESELFGHERGSFTGATERRLGKFELANGGTLFLDEIGEMPLDLQVKLLRALQEKEIERVGGKTTIKVDVRIIAATNRDLEKEMEEGRFRSDLFYRLNIFPISLPPLRERREDILLLATHFIQRYSKKAGKNISRLSTRAMEDLKNYDWPGNIRELEHLIERSVLLTSGDMIKQVHLPSTRQQILTSAVVQEVSLKTIDENEKDHIYNILKYCKGKIAGEGGAAEILGVPPTTLNSKIKRLGIRREHAK
ncbi:hypothetical protein RG47T_2168 [Mucilaginibacter polytrichastri]|uniref:Sigma-54 factor interaction domain-containing protein n=2 Tax=Mucilaginibacter polytrichastri TaxID=1302689 RepID=A0A1Q5ZY85_9SPHI|nr:hypothetical protein RG47T_2168 [Mucilaginibacter polytrichastri]